MGGEDYFAPGQWNAICDQCGQKFKSGAILREWDNLRVCSDCLDPRHPQELIRPVVDPVPPPWTRSDPPPTFVTPTYPPAFPGSHSINGSSFNYASID